MQCETVVPEGKETHKVIALVSYLEALFRPHPAEMRNQKSGSALVAAV